MRRLRGGTVGFCALAVHAVAASTASAAVDLEWRPQPLSVSVAQVFDLGVYAVSETGDDQGVSGVDLVLTWDPTKLVLIRDNRDGDYHWMFSGLQNDAQADGLNDSLADGDAFYQALASFSNPAIASGAGLKITSFRFEAIGKTDLTSVEIATGLGNYSRTHVYMAGAVNVDIKGNLGAADLEVLGKALLRIPDVSLPAGRTQDILVVGEIDNRETFGVEILLELVPRGGTAGTVIFTPAPPTDILQAGDAWPAAGLFTPFDTDQIAFSTSLNGSVDDNGVVVPQPVTYSGRLTAFPAVADELAAGEWELRLATSQGNSGWVELDSVLIPGTLRVVDLGDGDGSLGIDARDFSELARCFTGPGLGDGEPLYPDDPSARCAVYDFDDDGDVDADDYAGFHAAFAGPAP